MRSQITDILAPVEINENAIPVVAWAALSARATGSHLTLLHVNEALEPIKSSRAFFTKDNPETTAMIEEWRNAATEMARLELAQLAERFCAEVAVDTILLEGHARKTVLAHLEHTPADLVVVGTHGKPWYHQPLLGSTAETILRLLSHPVLIVHNAAPGQRRPRLHHLLCATDLSKDSLAAEEWTRFWAAHGVEEITLLHIVENPLLEVYEPDKVELAPRQPSEKSRPSTPHPTQRFWEHAHHAAQAKLSNLQQQFQAVSMQVELVIRDGPAAEAILNVAREKTVDLIIMGTHGRASRRRMLIGKETERVVSAASCPVLVVPNRP